MWKKRRSVFHIFPDIITSPGPGEFSCPTLLMEKNVSRDLESFRTSLNWRHLMFLAWLTDSSHCFSRRYPIECIFRWNEFLKYRPRIPSEQKRAIMMKGISSLEVVFYEAFWVADRCTQYFQSRAFQTQVWCWKRKSISRLFFSSIKEMSDF